MDAFLIGKFSFANRNERKENLPIQMEWTLTIIN